MLSNVIKGAKKYHFNRLIKNSDNKMKAIWAIAKLLTGKKDTKDFHQINVDGTVTSNGQIIANSFNNYFLSIIGNLTPVTKSRNLTDYLSKAFKEPLPTIKYQNTSIHSFISLFSVYPCTGKNQDCGNGCSCKKSVKITGVKCLNAIIVQW
jgi:hypothetical protein